MTAEKIVSMDQEKRDLEATTDQPGSYRLFPSVRLCMVLLAFFGSATSYCGFPALNFSIVCMVKTSVTNGTGNCSLLKSTGQFEWDRELQATLLSAYSWGSTSASILAGWMSDRYGGKWVLFACMIANAVSSALTPMAASRGLYWMLAARIVSGMAGGSSIPCVTTIATTWALPHERAMMTAFAIDGTTLSQLVVIGLAGMMCETGVGWPLVFYSSAGAAALMAVIWVIFYSDDPDKCSSISDTERRLLKISHSPKADDSNQKKLRTPWRHIIFSKTTWAIYICHFCATWSNTFVSMFVPTYSKEVLGVDMASNGLLSALPILGAFFSFFLFGVIADKLTCLSPTTSVKLFNSSGMGIPAMGMLALAFLNPSSGTVTAILIFCVCQFFNLSMTAGFLRSIILVAPNFCGTISAVSHFFSYSAAVAMPYAVGFITKHGTIGEWHTMFFVTLAVCAVGCVEFLIFGSGEEQDWAEPVAELSCDSEDGKQEEPVFSVVKY